MPVPKQKARLEWKLLEKRKIPLSCLHRVKTTTMSESKRICLTVKLVAIWRNTHTYTHCASAKMLKKKQKMSVECLWGRKKGSVREECFVEGKVKRNFTIVCALRLSTAITTHYEHTHKQKQQSPQLQKRLKINVRLHTHTSTMSLQSNCAVINTCKTSSFLPSLSFSFLSLWYEKKQSKWRKMSFVFWFPFLWGESFRANSVSSGKTCTSIWISST